jgi:hypothetical protein
VADRALNIIADEPAISQPDSSGVPPDQNDWVPTRPRFFLSGRVISRHLRQLFQEALRQEHPEPHGQVSAPVWTQEWVLHCISWGQVQAGALAPRLDTSFESPFPISASWPCVTRRSAVGRSDALRAIMFRNPSPIANSGFRREA